MKIAEVIHALCRSSGMAFDDKWITVNGAHIPVGKGGKLQGKTGQKISSVNQEKSVPEQSKEQIQKYITSLKEHRNTLKNDLLLVAPGQENTEGYKKRQKNIAEVERKIAEQSELAKNAKSDGSTERKKFEAKKASEIKDIKKWIVATKKGISSKGQFTEEEKLTLRKNLADLNKELSEWESKRFTNA